MVFGFGADKADALYEKGLVKQDKFAQSNRVEDLDAAIDLFNQATQAKGYDKLTAARRRALHGELGWRLVDRLNAASPGAARAAEDAKDAIVHFKQAIDATQEDEGPVEIRMVSALSDLLSFRAGSMRDSGLAEEAVRYTDAYARLLEEDAPEKIEALAKVSERFFQLYDISGDVEALDQAVGAGEYALRLAAGVGETGLHFMLAHFRGRRFEKSREPFDIERAVMHGEKALETIGRSDRRFLSHAYNLLINYSTLLNVGDDPRLLERALAFAEENDELFGPDHPLRAGFLNTRGGFHRRRHDLYREAGDLELAVEAYREAREIEAAAGEEDPGVVDNLRNALILRFAALKRREDVEEAIALTRRLMTMMAGRGVGRVQADALARELEDLEMRRDALD